MCPPGGGGRGFSGACCVSPILFGRRTSTGSLKGKVCAADAELRVSPAGSFEGRGRRLCARLNLGDFEFAYELLNCGRTSAVTEFRIECGGTPQSEGGSVRSF